MSQIVSTGGVEGGKAFWAGASGVWAGQRMMRALKRGEPLTPQVLRSYDTLRKDEWEFFDEELVEEAVIRLVGVADLMSAGLVRNVPDSMGKTVFEYEKVTDMDPATVSLDGATRSEGDRQEFTLSQLPLPITHKDFMINLRTLTASRTRGESLDTTQARTAGRLVSEEAEKMLFQGGKTFGGLTIYGYTDHPDRNTRGFSNVAWSGAASGDDMLTDVLNLKQDLEDARMFGPYWLYVPRNFSTAIDADFKAESDKTIRQRLSEVEGIQAIRIADQLPDSNVVLVQATMDVVAWVQGEQLQTIQWDVMGGFLVNFKAFQIAVPLVRSDAEGRSGVAHLS